MVKTDVTEIATEVVKTQESRREAQLCNKPDAWISKPQKQEIEMNILPIKCAVTRNLTYT